MVFPSGLAIPETSNLRGTFVHAALKALWQKNGVSTSGVEEVQWDLMFHSVVFTSARLRIIIPNLNSDGFPYLPLIQYTPVRGKKPMRNPKLLKQWGVVLPRSGENENLRNLGGVTPESPHAVNALARIFPARFARRQSRGGVYTGIAKSANLRKSREVVYQGGLPRTRV